MKPPPLLLDIQRLEGIRNDISALQGYSLPDFSVREKLHAAGFELVIIGEATKQISDIVKRTYPDLPWQDMADTRNRVVHEYHGIDPAAVMEIIENDLPALYDEIKAILASLKNQSV